MSRVVLEESFTATGASAIDIALDGTFNFSVDFSSGTGVGTIELQRSFDNKQTWKTTDLVSADDERIGEAVENSVRWRLFCTRTSGTILARISQ